MCDDVNKWLRNKMVEKIFKRNFQELLILEGRLDSFDIPDKIFKCLYDNGGTRETIIDYVIDESISPPEIILSILDKCFPKREICRDVNSLESEIRETVRTRKEIVRKYILYKITDDAVKKIEAINNIDIEDLKIRRNIKYTSKFFKDDVRETFNREEIEIIQNHAKKGRQTSEITDDTIEKIEYLKLITSKINLTELAPLIRDNKEFLEQDLVSLLSIKNYTEEEINIILQYAEHRIRRG